MGSDVEDLDMEESAEQQSSKVDKGKGKSNGKEDNEPPAALEGALHGHELDNLPW